MTPEQLNKESEDKPELSSECKRFPSLTDEQQDHLSKIDPSTALSPYEDTRKARSHMPSDE